MNSAQKNYVAGHRGMVASAIVRQLAQSGHSPESFALRTHSELALTNQSAVQAFFASEKPTQVYLAAASVHVMKLDKASYDAHTQPMQSHINVGCGEPWAWSLIGRVVIKIN